MKIAFLSPFYPYRGGIAQFGDSLYLALSQTNNVKAFTFTRQYPSILFPGKSQFVSIDDLNRNIQATRLLDSINPYTWYKTGKEIKKFSPDLVLISYWMPFFAPALGKVAALLKKNELKVIGLLHNVIAHEKRFGDLALTKYFINRCSGFVLLNNHSEKDLLKLKPDAKYIIQSHPLYDHYGIKMNQIDAKKKLDVPPEKKVILFFGFIRDYKGLDLLIEALKYLNDEYILLIAGENYGDFKKYDEQIDNLGIRKRINMHIRYIPESEIPVFFSASDVCVLPYRSATQSGITGIAYHFKIPVIVTNVGGLSEMVIENKTGLIINDLKPEKIAAKINNFFKENLKEKFVPGIIEYKKEHSWQQLSNAITNFKI
ncbi:MAG: glycosyltransferase [Ignavibacteria bacterium]|nr:glycosyltransferase [Ignavibacteria bacterium]